ncbi:MAG: signal recognition particle protein [Bacteroidetes bacterium RIFCSPLOWO2_02_FULL_36_8]|nr:MAG: signal recognition particle protein [Bacteroidetes bacterium RIFCSPLOWO2_02_FULL_36_8]OFY70276.1 MAG: signal recognition particle protein [Bacteroidetes bacterium RIFCSPLOWO2_12_FULL_37_12]
MFESLSSRIDHALKVLKGHGRITEINIAETVKEIRRALIDADVSYKIAKSVTDTIKEKAIGQQVLISVTPGQLLIKIMAEELTQLMGATHQEIKLNGNPPVVLVSGLQGSGKTTFCGKLAHYLKAKGRMPLLVAADVYRPAAIEQLKVLGEQIQVEVFADIESKDPVSIAEKAIQHASIYGHNPLIIDTAGRLAVDKAMMDEISRIHKKVKPSETLFVVDSMTGQDAVNTAKAFNDVLDFDGVVLTKLDGDTRGGAALTIRSIVQKPIKFISTGEKMEALDVFHPDRMAQRILGMGDVLTLVEKAQEQFDVEETRRMTKKLHKNQYNLEDFFNQLKQIKKMGNIKELASMIPGIGKQIKDVEIEDDAFKPIEAIIQSMTPYERQNPEELNGSRKKRIAQGSGTNVQEINNVVNQFMEMRKMMKTVSKLSSSGRAVKDFSTLRG